MKNSWLNKVLGESEQTPAPVKAPMTTVQQVLGEEESEPSPEPAPEAAPESGPTPSEQVGGVEAEVGGVDRVNSPVQALTALWTSGAKMDVAVKLLSEPISNRDFVQLVLTIGNEGAMELGQILDDMQAGAGDEDPGEDAVLDRVAAIRQGRSQSPEETEAGDFRERHAAGDPTAIAAGEQ